MPSCAPPTDRTGADQSTSTAWQPRRLPDVTFRRADGVLSETADGRAMLAASSGAEVIVLNETGTLVWDLLADHGDPNELVRLVHEAYPEVAGDAIERDVHAFLDELVAADLVEPV
jgi:hypothetical protein